MLVEYILKEENLHPEERKFTYDSENDILKLGREEDQPLILEQKYFKLLKRNVIEVNSQVDAVVDDHPSFFMKCLTHRLKKFGIEAEYQILARIKRKPIFVIKSDEDYAYFLFLYHDNIAKSD